MFFDDDTAERELAQYYVESWVRAWWDHHDAYWEEQFAKIRREQDTVAPVDPPSKVDTT